MRRLNLIIPKTVDEAIKKVLLEIQNWANSIRNITADQLELYRGDFYPGVIDWPEWHIPLALPADDYISFDTAYSRCSGIYQWDPIKYPAVGKWYFEASMAIADAAQTVSVRLMGASQICVLTRTGSTDMQVIRSSSAITMPSELTNLYVEMKSSSTSVQASFGGARLVFVPD